MLQAQSQGGASCGRTGMSTTVALVVASAMLGVVIGAKYCVFTIVGLAPVLAILAVLAVRDVYSALADEFAFAFVCIIVNQTAYFVTAWLILLLGSRQNRPLQGLKTSH
jgi:hypothetical protein